jgi:putative sterol carrier protein
MHDAFSAAWADAWRAAINADATYADAGARWRDALALTCAPDADAGFPAGAAVEVALDAGTCTAARAVAADATDAPVVLHASPATWRAMLDGTLDPVAGVAMGRVKLARGSLGTVMMHAAGLKALVACAQRVPTRWPG